MRREPGIYKITCRATGKVYVGSAVNMYRRWHSYHLPDLRRNTHHNPYLQAAWNKYGEDVFVCEAIELCSREQLLVREQHWMDQLDSTNKKVGFNLAKKAGSTLGVPQSAKCKQAILAAKCKTYIVRSPAGRETVITNLHGFCKRRGLTSTVMNKVACGKARHHQRWECRPANMSRNEWLNSTQAAAARPLKIQGNKVWCSKCQKYKASESFNRDKQQRSGFAAYCRTCNMERLNKQYQQRRAS